MITVTHTYPTGYSIVYHRCCAGSDDYALMTCIRIYDPFQNAETSHA